MEIAGGETQEIFQNSVSPNFDTLISNPYTISWADSIVGEQPALKSARQNKPSKKFVEFTIESTGYLTLEDDETSTPITFSLLAEKTDQGLKNFILVKFVPNDDKVKVSGLSYLNMKDFDGTVYKYDSLGELIGVEGYEKGVLEAILILEEIKDLSFSSARMADMPCYGCEDGGSWQLIIVSKFTDWYQSVDGSPLRYVGSEYNGRSTEYVYVSDPYGSVPENKHEHKPGNGTGSTTSSGHFREVTPTPAFCNSKAGCVYSQLAKTGIASKYLSRFDGRFPTAHLRFDLSKDLPNNVNGTTSKLGYHVLVIKINENTLAGRDVVGIARTLMHEIIHAEMYRIVISLGHKLNPHDYPGIYDYYFRYGRETYQHQQMAAHYTKIIGEAIAEFDGYKHSLQYYTDLAWEGLIEDVDENGNKIYTTAWDELASADKSRILQHINQSKTGNKVCDKICD